MGPESKRAAYDVHLIRHDGTTEVFTRYDAAKPSLTGGGPQSPSQIFAGARLS